MKCFTPILATFFLFILFQINHGFSQAGDQNLKFGRIPQEDLEMSVYALDSSAEAVVLDDVGEMFFFSKGDDIAYKFNRHVRIKILTEAGYDQAEQQIDFYSYKRIETVSGLKAHVVNPDGSISKLNKNNIFEEKINDYWESIRLTFPNIQPGSILEYSYTLESKRFTTPRDWTFQRKIPVRYSQIYFDPGEFFDFLVYLQGVFRLPELCIKLCFCLL